jgi:Flp pilus assembly protein TadG
VGYCILRKALLVTKRKKHKAFIKSPGQALVEFALVLPLLLLLILGAMDRGRVITTKMVMTNAAREGANYLSRNAFSDKTVPVATRLTETRTLIADYGLSQDIIIDTTEDIDIQGCCTKGSPVTITVTQEVDLIFGTLLQFLGVEVEVSSEVVMRVR